MFFKPPQDSEPAVSESSRVQDALEAATQAQSELEFAHAELQKAQDEFQAARDEIQRLKADKQRAQAEYAEHMKQCSDKVTHEELRKAQSECRALRDAETHAQEEIQRLVADRQQAQTERSELMDRCSAQAVHIQQANAQIEELLEAQQKYEKRIEALVVERGNAHLQLKQQLRAPSDGRPKNGDDLSFDPFDNKVDQVSEAAVKSGVESLNDSVDNFTMALLEDAEELAKRHSHSSVPSAVQEHERTKLLVALAEFGHLEEKRGFLLDAKIHSSLVDELNELFFSGEVVCRTTDPDRLISTILKEMTKQKQWSVVQRWRALTAETTSNLRSSIKRGTASVTHCSESIVALLAWAYRQPLETFEPLAPKIQSQLEALYEEAYNLSIIVRRDVLSVRMAVVAPADPKVADVYLPYDPDEVTSVYPDMKVIIGDEIIGLYKFGLRRLTEKGQISYLIKPEVTTTALLREMAKT